jgi:uncharacterized protein (DUF2267 family)
MPQTPGPSGSGSDPIAATQRFFARLEGSGTVPARVSPADAASSVLCALSLRLSAEDAQRLVQAMPTSLRALVTPCVRHREEPAQPFGVDEFLARVAEHLETTSPDARRLAVVVLGAMRDELPRPEAEAFARRLPREFQELVSGDEAAA